ncbi:MAG: c-type cytochrome [Phyllobacterium sp.]
MKKALAILAFAAFATAPLTASADAIADRQALMKDTGAAVKTIAPIAQGKADFDAAVVLAALTKINENAQKLDFATHYPAGSDKGDTEASPKIWEDPAGFEAALAKYKKDAAAAVAANPQDIDSFKAQFGVVAANCGACHETFRIKK